jgi:hypothetical protein
MNGRSVVDQQIDPIRLVRDTLEQRSNRGIVTVVDGNRNSAVAGVSNRSAGQIHPPAVCDERRGDTASCTATRPRHDRN